MFRSCQTPSPKLCPVRAGGVLRELRVGGERYGHHDGPPVQWQLRPPGAAECLPWHEQCHDGPRRALDLEVQRSTGVAPAWDTCTQQCVPGSTLAEQAALQAHNSMIHSWVVGRRGSGVTLHIERAAYILNPTPQMTSLACP